MSSPVLKLKGCMKILFVIIAIQIASFAFCHGVEIDLKQAEKVDAGRISLLPKNRPEKRVAQTEDPLGSFRDEDVFISIEGGDALTWKSLREWIDYTVQQVRYRADMQDSGSAAMRSMVIQKELSKNLKSFLRYALIAKEAKRMGIVADEGTVARVKEEWFELYRKSGAAGAAKIRAAEQPDSFFEHALTNSVLWKAYADNIVKPSLKITDEEIARRIERQEKSVSDVILTNTVKRALIYDILKKVKYGPKAQRMSFAAAAEKWTDDYNGDEGGVFSDENGNPRNLVEGDVIKQVEDAYRKLKPGETSDVIETPYSWHIVKLINRNLDDDGEVESVNIAHIMLEKVPMPALFSVEDVRHRLTNAKLRIAMEEKYLELLKSEKINCLIPLFDKEEKNTRKFLKNAKKKEI